METDPADLSRVTATGVDGVALRSLHRWNVVLTVLHLAQAVGVLLLATGFTVTVTRSLPTGPPARRARRPRRRRRCSTYRSAPRSRRSS